MRKKIGKRVGPVPIAVVAALALAAFISAGLWLAPGNGQTAEAADTTSHTIDVQQAILATDKVQLDFPFSRASTDSISFAVTRIDNEATAETDDPPNDNEDLGNLESSDFTAEAIKSRSSTAVITLPAGNANASEVGSRRVYVTATYVAGSAGTAQSPITKSFMLNVVQNPILIDGVKVKNPTMHQTADGDAAASASINWGAGACDVSSDGTLGSRQSFPVDHDNNASTPKQNRRGHLTGSNLLVSGGDCTTTGDSVKVTFENIAGQPETLLIYQTMGSSYKKVMPVFGTAGLDKKVVELKADNNLAYEDQTLTVSRPTGADNATIYLIGYGGGGATASDGLLTDTATTFRDNADFVVEVLFLGAPVKVKDKDDMTGSVLSFGTDAAASNVFDAADKKITVTADVEDAAGNAMVDGRVNFTVKYDAGSALKAGSEMSYTDRVAVTSGTASLDLTEFKTGDEAGAVSVMVSATYTGVTGTVDLIPSITDGKVDPAGITIGRPGPLDSVSAVACMDDSKNEDDADGCGKGSKPMSVFAPGESFDVMAKAMDSLGTELTPSTFEVSAAAADKANFDELKSTGKTSLTSGKATITVADAATMGPYTLTVTAKTGTGDSAITKTAEVMVTITGKADMISVSCDPNPAPVTTGQTDCVATVTDSAGNVPNNLVTTAGADDRSTILVTVRDKEAQIVGATNNRVNLSAKGMASFSVLFAADAVGGTSTTINVSSTIGDATMQQSVVVTYGEAQEPTPAELTKPTVSSVNPAGSGIAIVAWETVPAATEYIIAAVNLNDGDDYTAKSYGADSTSGSALGLKKGETYLVFVVAIDAKGNFKLSDATQIDAE